MFDERFSLPRGCTRAIMHAAWYLTKCWWWENFNLYWLAIFFWIFLKKKLGESFLCLNFRWCECHWSTMLFWWREEILKIKSYWRLAWNISSMKEVFVKIFHLKELKQRRGLTKIETEPIKYIKLIKINETNPVNDILPHTPPNRLLPVWGPVRAGLDLTLEAN